VRRHPGGLVDDDVLAKARESDEAVAAARAGAVHAGEPDPYRKPREDELDAAAGDESAEDA
jgi:ribosome-binding factor A